MNTLLAFLRFRLDFPMHIKATLAGAYYLTADRGRVSLVSKATKTHERIAYYRASVNRHETRARILCAVNPCYDGTVQGEQWHMIY